MNNTKTIGMIADYIIDNAHYHNEFLAHGAGSIEDAVNTLVKTLEDGGADVQAVIVCPDVCSLTALKEIADKGIQKGQVYFVYTFDD